MHAAKALPCHSILKDSPEYSLLDNAISAKITCADPYKQHMNDVLRYIYIYIYIYIFYNIDILKAS